MKARNGQMTTGPSLGEKFATAMLTIRQLDHNEHSWYLGEEVKKVHRAALNFFNRNPWVDTTDIRISHLCEMSELSNCVYDNECDGFRELRAALNEYATALYSSDTP